MGRGSTEAAYRVGTVDCMTSLCKEDRVRHRSIVELLGVVILLHPESAKAPNWRLMGGKAGRYRPVVTRNSVDLNRHPLRILVDSDGHLRLSGYGDRKQKHARDWAN